MHTLVGPPPKDATRPEQPAAVSQKSSPANRNLYDLFIEELGSITLNAEYASRAATRLHEGLPNDQFALRQLAKRFSRDACSWGGRIADALRAERLELPIAACSEETDLIDTYLPGAHSDSGESWGVAGIRIVSAIRKLCLHFSVKSDEASQFGFLLGADAVHRALSEWSGKWEENAKRFQRARSSFCAAAYMADVDFNVPFSPGRQSFPVITATQPNAPTLCSAGY